MAVTLATSSTTSNIGSASASLVLTKPTGLAVGDIMVALFGVQTNTSVTKPSGWATHVSDATIGGGSAAIYADYKIADSSDVAASNFTWTFSSVVNAGVIMRITGGITDQTKWKSAASVTTNTQDPSFTGVTPTVAGGNLLILGTWIMNAGTTLSGWAIATNDPGGWTELLDVANGSVNTFGVAWALRSNQTSATGNATVHLAADATNQMGGILLAIPQYVDFTITDTVTVTDSVSALAAYTSTTLDTITVTDSIEADDSNVRNSTKHSSTFTNTDKS